LLGHEVEFPEKEQVLPEDLLVDWQVPLEQNNPTLHWAVAAQVAPLARLKNATHLSLEQYEPGWHWAGLFPLKEQSPPTAASAWQVPSDPQK